MGQAEPWQAQVESALEDLDLTIWNPRRDEWDAGWLQTLDDPRFVEQVNWELEGQERADLILMYFSPASRAPITLLELGLFSRSQRIVVACPTGFWRKGNVEIVARRYGIPMVDDIHGLVATARSRFGP